MTETRIDYTARQGKRFEAQGFGNIALLDKLYSSNIVGIVLLAQQAIQSKEAGSDGLPDLLHLLAQKVLASGEKVPLSDVEQGLLESWLSYDPLAWYTIRIDYRILAPGLEFGDFRLSLEQPARNSLEAAHIALGRLIGFLGNTEIGGLHVSVVKKFEKGGKYD